MRLRGGRSIPRTGVIGERKLRTEAGSSWTGGDRHAHRPGACHRVRSEFLTDAANSAAALGKIDRWVGRSGALIHRAALSTRVGLGWRAHENWNQQCPSKRISNANEIGRRSRTPLQGRCLEEIRWYSQRNSRSRRQRKSRE